MDCSLATVARLDTVWLFLVARWGEVWRTLTVIIGKNLQSLFFSFTFKPKILQIFISSQLTTRFRQNSHKRSMRHKSVVRQIEGKIYTHLKKRSENPSYPIQLTQSQAMAQ